MPNGMKSGSGEDPFEGLEGGDEDDEGDEPEEPTEMASASESATSELGADDSDEESDTSSSTGLPWKYSRENVKAQRDMVQFYLQSETKTMESQAEGELEGMLGESVLTFDLREAAYQVALQQHLDDVADQLREWGYDAE